MAKRRMAPVVTIIGHQTEIGGGLNFGGGLHVDGLIHGDVEASGDRPSAVTISHGGAIEGSVRAKDLRVDGRILGDVFASGSVELGSHAKITGDVHYGLLEMAMGAEVNGKLVKVKNDANS
ncbi:MAG: bactofilin family protein [bacterium]